MFITAGLVIVGIINFVPVLGLLSARQMESSYSIKLESPDLVILMRHRALLFGIVGAFILYSAFHPPFQNAAMLMAGISMLGYVVLVPLVGGYNRSIHKVLIIDIVGLVILIATGILKYVQETV